MTKEIELYAKNTVGYNEAVNKRSFMVGVSVAISRAEELYNAQITDLKRQVETYKSAHENAEKDLMTLSKILSKYSEQCT